MLIDPAAEATGSAGTALAASDFALDSVDLYITAQCNRRCEYCFLSEEFLGSAARMDYAMAFDVLAWCDGHVREVTVLGGEPSLHPDLLKILIDAKRRGMATRLVTNGSAPFRRFIHSGGSDVLDSAAISLDHFDPAAVQALRGRQGFHDAVASAALLEDRGTPFAINCTVTSLLGHDLERMIEFVESLGATRLNLHWFSPVGRGRARRDLQLSPLEWRRILDVVASYRAPRGDFQVDCEVGWLFDDLPASAEPFDCAVRSRRNLQFMPDGAVFSCGMLVEDPTRSAYVWNAGSVWPRARGETENDLTTPGCTGCPVRTRLRGYQDDHDLPPACIYQRAFAPGQQRAP